MERDSLHTPSRRSPVPSRFLTLWIKAYTDPEPPGGTPWRKRSPPLPIGVPVIRKSSSRRTGVRAAAHRPSPTRLPRPMVSTSGCHISIRIPYNTFNVRFGWPEAELLPARGSGIRRRPDSSEGNDKQACQPRPMSPYSALSFQTQSAFREGRSRPQLYINRYVLASVPVPLSGYRRQGGRCRPAENCRLEDPPGSRVRELSSDGAIRRVHLGFFVRRTDGRSAKMGFTTRRISRSRVVVNMPLPGYTRRPDTASLPLLEKSTHTSERPTSMPLPSSSSPICPSTGRGPAPWWTRQY